MVIVLLDSFTQIIARIKNKPKINDIYKAHSIRPKVSNPFERVYPILIGHAKILEITDGWVRYTKTGIVDGETELIKEFQDQALNRHSKTFTLPWSKFLAEYPNRITGLTREDQLDLI
jgi:hypothetical protein